MDNISNSVFMHEDLSQVSQEPAALEKVRTLYREAGSKKNFINFYPLFARHSNGEDEIISFILEGGNTFYQLLNHCDDDLLEISIERAHLQVVKKLISIGVEVTNKHIKLADDSTDNNNKSILYTLILTKFFEYILKYPDVNEFASTLPEPVQTQITETLEFIDELQKKNELDSIFSNRIKQKFMEEESKAKAIFNISRCINDLDQDNQKIPFLEKLVAVDYTSLKTQCLIAVYNNIAKLVKGSPDEAKGLEMLKSLPLELQSDYCELTGSSLSYDVGSEYANT